MQAGWIHAAFNIFRPYLSQLAVTTASYFKTYDYGNRKFKILFKLTPVIACGLDQDYVAPLRLDKKPLRRSMHNKMLSIEPWWRATGATG
ncbi:hypothetical protein [Pseudomonas sp. SMN5]|uniref:hypothetical protein n=1 Tax=Pseudomonas sp. SMN5 TaxID=3390198 RepID=UPI003F851741